jgi:hypothetical protein
LRKLEVTDRVQAVLYAVKNGWIEVGPSLPPNVAPRPRLAAEGAV